MRALAALVWLAAHPLHTTLTQLTWRPSEGAVEISIRAFADDFLAATAQSRGTPDSGAVVYLRERLTLVDAAGRQLPLVWCGVRRTGDLLWLCLRAAAPRGLAGAGVRVALLFDRYDDQINIVQASYAGRRESLLFARGDGLKRLP